MNKSVKEIWVECTCGYKGNADMVSYDTIPDVFFPTCPICGETIYDIDYSGIPGC